MSKKLTYRGILPTGEQTKIKLRTIKGKVGYKITKLQAINQAPGTIDSQTIVKVFKTDQTGNVNATIDFSNPDLIAMLYQKTGNSGGDPAENIIIMDSEIVNQDIFLYVTDAIGNTTPINYYLELEAMALSDLESTMITLKSLRTVSS